MCHGSVLALRQEPAVVGETYLIAQTDHVGFRHGVLHRPGQGPVRIDGERGVECAICIETPQPVRLQLPWLKRMLYGLAKETPALFRPDLPGEDLLEFADGRLAPLRDFANWGIRLTVMAIPEKSDEPTDVFVPAAVPPELADAKAGTLLDLTV